MADLDPRLIRVLARHFAYLQGLRLIAIAVFLQSIAQLWLATHSELWTMAGGAAASGLHLALLHASDLYYARFGRVVPASLPRWSFHVFIFSVTFLLPMPLRGFPNLVWIGLSAVPLWVAWDCRPYRWHHLLTCVAMLYVAFGRVAYREAGDLAWMAPRMWAFSSALVITGVLDHRLFVGTMLQTRVAAREVS